MTAHPHDSRGMTHELVERYSASVPRYTSYPTAPHFTDGFSADTYADWLSALPNDASASLYMHIPYCKEMCWYCGCFTKIVKRYDPISDYVSALLQETDLVAAAAGHPLRAKFLHWGGGSPTILSADDWRRTMDRLHHNFIIDSDAEIAVELDPRTTTPDYVKALAECGVNRVSIGVQDFAPHVQQAINRIQPYEVTERVVRWLHNNGIDIINFDLMYGLPHQGLDDVKAMTEKALLLEPSRIALFGYAHVPWMRAHQRLIDNDALPDTAARWAQSETAAAMLGQAGYVRIGFDHFAHPRDPLAQAADQGELSRNFQGYTTDSADALIGLGASSIGTLPQGYVQNTPNLRQYMQGVSEGRLPISRGLRLSEDDVLRRNIIDQLMCNLEIEIGDTCTAFGQQPSLLDESIAKLRDMEQDGLLRIDGRRIEVTELGRPLVRMVAAAFDAYLPQSTARHSSAV